MKGFYIFSISLLAAISVYSFANKKNPEQANVESGLRPKVFISGQRQEKWDINERMELYGVPGISLAIIDDYQIRWTKGYGHIEDNPSSPLVTEHTLFQAASISKPVTAFGAMILVQQGKLSLDEDVNNYLKRWKVPENEFTKSEKVTLRRLLSHTAGTNVSGFGGYSSKDPIPSLSEVLEGKKPKVNTDPITVVAIPGTELKYSGGGTTIVQLLIEDLTGEHFDEWMSNNVLKPLDMTESTFSQPLSQKATVFAAHGHHLNHVSVEGSWHVYPEMAAAGLWTTSKDLAKFVLYIQKALKGDKNEPLSQKYVSEMITKQQAGGKEIVSGLGFFIKGEGKDLIFFHNGQNEGFISRILGYAHHGQGIAIMMNNDAGWNLIEEITNSAADFYHWPDSGPILKKAIDVPPSSLVAFQGHFEHENEKLELSIENGKLYINFQNGIAKMRLYPSERCHFFMQEANASVEFTDCDHPDALRVKDETGGEKLYKRK